MTKSLFAIAAIFAMTAALSTAAFASAVAFASTAKTIPSTTNEMDYGVVVGALASKVRTAKIRDYTYSVIAADFTEPACNSTQIVLWVSGEGFEGDAGGIAFNLGYQAASVTSVKVVKDEVEIKFKLNNIDDCSTSVAKTVYVKYTAGAVDLSVRE